MSQNSVDFISLLDLWWSDKLSSLSNKHFHLLYIRKTWECCRWRRRWWRGWRTWPPSCRCPPWCCCPCRREAGTRRSTSTHTQYWGGNFFLNFLTSSTFHVANMMRNYVREIAERWAMGAWGAWVTGTFIFQTESDSGSTHISAISIIYTLSSYEEHEKGRK